MLHLWVQYSADKSYAVLCWEAVDLVTLGLVLQNCNKLFALQAGLGHGKILGIQLLFCFCKAS